MRFERTAYRVGVIRQSREKGCIHASFGASAQVISQFTQNGQALVRQRLARFKLFSEIVVKQWPERSRGLYTR